MSDKDKELPLNERRKPSPGNLGRADYPRMLYHGDGGTMTVETPQEHDEMTGHGWVTEPSEVHYARPVTTSPALSGADPMATMMREVMREVLEEILDERGVGTTTRRKSTHGR